MEGQDISSGDRTRGALCLPLDRRGKGKKKEQAIGGQGGMFTI